MIVDKDFLPLVEEFYKSFPPESIPEHEHEVWRWILYTLPKDVPGFYVSVLMNEGNTIDMLNCSFTINRMWDLPSNSLPEWVIGLTRARQKSGRVRTYDIEEMMWPVIKVMERQGRNAFYMVRSVPRYVNWSNVDQYTSKKHPLIGNFYRYETSVQHLMSNPSELDRLPNLYRRLSPPEWSSNKKMAILRHELKSQYRGK